MKAYSRQESLWPWCPMNGCHGYQDDILSCVTKAELVSGKRDIAPTPKERGAKEFGNLL